MDYLRLYTAVEAREFGARPGSEHGWGHIPDVCFTPKDGGPVELVEFKTSNCASAKWADKAANFDELFAAVQDFWALSSFVKMMPSCSPCRSSPRPCAVQRAVCRQFF